MNSTIQKKTSTVTSPSKPAAIQPATAKTVSKPTASANTPAKVLKDEMSFHNPTSFRSFSNPSGTGSVRLPLAKPNAQQTQATYPPEVTAVLGDVNAYLNRLTPPASVAANGASAVNEWKMQQLSAELHRAIYNDDGTYRPHPPFNDAQAAQTMYSAAAQLSYDTLVAAGKAPYGADRPEWNRTWAGLAGAGIQANSFGDYGWDPIYQDGTPMQSSHFQLALIGSMDVDTAVGQALGGIPVIGGGLQWLANGILGNNTAATFVSQLGNYQHEYQGSGPSKQDAFASMFAILVTRDVKAGNLDPFSASTVIGQGLQSGDPILSMDFSNPSNYLWAAPALGLPDAQIDQSRYPH